MSITEKEIKEFEAYEKERTSFLTENGWTSYMKSYQGSHMTKPCEVLLWVDPETQREYYDWEAYDGLTSILLKKRGWKAILQVKYIGKHCKREDWGRFQSPETKRIYSFLEAQSIMERKWDESNYPTGYSENTIKLNQLVGENFDGSSVETWFHTINGKNDLELWKN